MRLTSQGIAPASKIIERQPGGKGRFSLRRLYGSLLRIVVVSESTSADFTVCLNLLTFEALSQRV